MKNLPKRLPAFLLLLFVALACNNPLARQEPTIARESPPPTANPDISPVASPALSESLNNKATSLPKPVYPPAARAVKATGEVRVQVKVDEKGNVTSAKAESGHPLLRQAAEQAAKQAKFKPLAGITEGVIIYNFTGE
ncbi:MAG TPA: TonB family protein [Pyrinomonadaceae bacterium]